MVTHDRTSAVCRLIRLRPNSWARRRKVWRVTNDVIAVPHGPCSGNGLQAPLPAGVSAPESFPPSFVHQIAVSFFHGVSWFPRKLLGMTRKAASHKSQQQYLRHISTLSPDQTGAACESKSFKVVPHPARSRAPASPDNGRGIESRRAPGSASKRCQSALTLS
jgi:hypothetical protein